MIAPSSLSPFLRSDPQAGQEIGLNDLKVHTKTILGKGSMGVVYRAEHHVTKQMFALKVNAATHTLVHRACPPPVSLRSPTPSPHL